MPLALIVLAACGGRSGKEKEEFSVLDVGGVWELYRTYDDGLERGPDASQWSNSGTGFGIRLDLLCSTYVVPGGHMALAGEIHGQSIAVSGGPGGDDFAEWVGTVSGTTMAGTFAETRESIQRAGTWRAVKVPPMRCTTYEVYGGAAELGCGGLAGYNPELNGYTFLGTDTSTATFDGEYDRYYVVTRDKNVVRVDSVETPAGEYPGTTGSDGNTTDYLNIRDPPDGMAAIVGAGAISQGGYVEIAPEFVATSITVHVLAPP
jgi:hypothetical protein